MAPAAAAETQAGLSAWHLGIAFDSEILVNGSNPLLMFDELRGLGSCALEAAWENVPPLHDLHPQTLYFHLDGRVQDARADRGAGRSLHVRPGRHASSTRRRFLSSRAPFLARDTEAAEPLARFLAGTAAGPAGRSGQGRRCEPARTALAPAKPAAGDPAAAAPGDAGAARAGKDSSTIRVPAERLDEMMDRVGRTRHRAGAPQPDRGPARTRRSSRWPRISPG